MSEQEILDLKHDIAGFDKELEFRVRQIDELRADLRLIIRLNRDIRGTITEGSNQKQPSTRWNQEDIERCKKLVVTSHAISGNGTHDKSGNDEKDSGMKVREILG